MICGRKPITRDTAQQPGKDEFTRAAAPPVDGACACGTAVAQRSPVLDAAQAVAYCTAAAQRTRSLRVMVSWAASPAGRPSAAARSTAVRRLVKAPLPGWGAEAPGRCPCARPGSGSRCRLLRWRVRWRCRSRSRGSGRRPEAGPGARAGGTLQVAQVGGGAPARQVKQGLVAERDVPVRQAAQIVPGMCVVAQPVPAQCRPRHGHQVLEEPREQGGDLARPVIEHLGQ